MAGDSGRVVAQRRQGHGRVVEVAAAQTEETTPTQAAHAVREAGEATGASALPKFPLHQRKADDRDGRPF